MRKILLAAACATILGGPAATAQQTTPQLSPKDPKYNTAACRSMREKAKNLKDGLFEQDAGSYIVAAIMPGGTVGFTALQHRKREMMNRQVELACMTNPPARPYLDPATTHGR